MFRNKELLSLGRMKKMYQKDLHFFIYAESGTGISCLEMKK